MSTNFDTILDEAAALVDGPREVAYGSPLDNWGRTAQIMSAILEVEVTPEQAALCLVGVKLARCVNKIGRDNLVDIAGYARVVERIQAEREERARDGETTHG